jgi:hypothetical protein
MSPFPLSRPLALASPKTPNALLENQPLQKTFSFQTKYRRLYQ